MSFGSESPSWVRWLYVVSYQELRPDTQIQPVGRISLNGFNPRAGVTVGGVPLSVESIGSRNPA